MLKIFIILIIIIINNNINISLCYNNNVLPDKTNIELWECDNIINNNNNNNIYWNLPNKNHNIVALNNNNKCIDISGYSKSINANIWLYTCHNNDHNPNHQNQEFTMNKNGEIHSDYCDLCIGVDNVINGGNVILNNCSLSSSKWIYNQIDSTYRPIQNQSLCLSAGPKLNCQNSILAKNPYCNESLSINTRITDLLSRLTVSEKINNLQNANSGVPRLGIPNIPFSECLHGVLSGCLPNPVHGSTGCPTSFPSGIGIGASFNMSLVKIMAQTISTEARTLNNEFVSGIMYWAPDINLFRDPRWGRGQEVPGEDPHLTSEYVRHYSYNLQFGEDPRYLKIVSTCKHYFGYDLENWNGTDRYHFNAKINYTDMIEYYLPVFHECITAAKVRSVMCSYNAVNGVPSCANSFALQDVLRKQWGFKGFVVSDCGAIDDIFTDHHYSTSPEQAVSDSLIAGTDVNCGSYYAQHLPTAFSKGMIKESDLDLALGRLYTQMIELGMLASNEEVIYKSYGPQNVDSIQHRQYSLNAAQQSIVLLKNNNNILPILKDTVKNIALIGPHANATQAMLSNYHGTNTLVNSHSPLQAAQRNFPNLMFHYAHGCDIDSQNTTGFSEAINAAKISDVAIVFLGLDQSQESEGHDRTSLSLPGVQNELIQQISTINKRTIVVLIHGGQVSIEWIAQNIDGIITAFYPGQMGGDAIMDILFGNISPSGRLPYTFYPTSFVNERSFFDMNLRNNGGITYMYYQGEPIWEFGHGLSYATFKYVWNNIPPLEIINENDLYFSVNVTNTGKYDADVSVLANVYGELPKYPQRKLFAFQKIHLNVNETRTMIFTTPPSTFAYTANNGEMLLIPRKVTISINQDLVHELEIKKFIVLSKKNPLSDLSNALLSTKK